MPRRKHSHKPRSKCLLGLLSLVSVLSFGEVVPILLGKFPVALAEEFKCDGQFYQIRASSGTSQLYKVNRRTGTYQTDATAKSTNVLLNGMGYNKKDNYLYAIYLGPSTSSTPGTSNVNGLYKISLDGSAESLGKITDLPDGYLPTAAEFDDDTGNLYVTRASGDNTLYRINIIDKKAYSIPLKDSGGSLTTIPNIGDMSFNPTEGKLTKLLYGVEKGELFTINPRNGEVKKYVIESHSWGSTFFDTTGNFYAYDNGSGTISETSGGFYHIDIVSKTVTKISAAPGASRSDGAVCSFIPPTLDVVKYAGTVIRVNATTFDIPYTVAIKNTGGNNAPNVQINEDLKMTFATGNPTIVIGKPTVTGAALEINPNFYTPDSSGKTETTMLKGSTATPPIDNNVLLVGETSTISFTVRVTYPNIGSVPSSTTKINNTVRASTISTPNNPGFYTPTGSTILLPPPDVLDVDESLDVTNDTDKTPTRTDGFLPTSVTLPTTSHANVLLVKRITKINSTTSTGEITSTAFTGVEDNPLTTNDNNANWPSGFLKGKVDGGTVKPGDEIEYTIYFLNSTFGDTPTLRICDRLTGRQTLSGTTIDLLKGDGTSTFGTISTLTTAADGDRATSYSDITTLTNCNLPSLPAETNKTGIAVNIGGTTGTPSWSTLAGTDAPGKANSYGYIRFKTKVNK
jgi:hypothetical protein